MARGDKNRLIKSNSGNANRRQGKLSYQRNLRAAKNNWRGIAFSFQMVTKCKSKQLK